MLVELLAPRLQRRPLALDQRVPDEQLARERPVDRAVVDQPVGDQRHAVQRDPLACHDGGALGRPVRLGVLPLHEVAGQLLGPLGLDRRYLAGPQARGLHELTGHDERRRPPFQPRAREDREPRAAGAEVLPRAGPLALAPPPSTSAGRACRDLLLLQHPDVGEQAGEQRLVDAVGVRSVGGHPQLDLHLLAHLAQLGLEVLPLTDAQVVEVLALAHAPERARGQLALLLADVAPQVDPGEQVRALGLEPGVQLVGLRALLGRSLARVLERHRRDDDEDLADTAEAVGLEDHPAQARVDRQPRQAAAGVGEGVLAVAAGAQGTELLEQLEAGADVAAVRRLDEREAGDVAEAERAHLQDDAGQVGAQDLGVGELRSAEEVLLGVEPDADARPHAAAATGALVGRGLADGLDGQPLHLGAQGVAADAGDAGVDDVPDAGDRQRRLGDVGGQHHAAPGVRREDAVLLGGGEPRVERHDLDAPARAPQRARRVLQGVRGVADLPLAGQEDQHVARALGRELADRVDDRLGLVTLDHLALVVILGQFHQRPVADLHRVGASAHLDDRRRGPVAVGEVLGEALHVDGRGGDDELEVRPARQQPLEVAEQEVDVERALVGLVDDDRVVAPQHPVALQLGEQDAVGHQLHAGVGAGAVGEAHLVAHDRLLPQRLPELVGDALGDRAGGDPPRLGVADQPAARPLPPVAGLAVRRAAAPQLQADLRQLGGLARAGLAGHDDDLVVADGLGDVVLALADREVGGVADLERLALHRRPCLHDGAILSSRR